MATSPLVFTDILGQPKVEPSVSSLWTFDQTTQSRFVAQHDVVLLSWMEGGPTGVTPFIDIESLQNTYDPQNLHILGVELARYLKVPSFDLNVRGAYRIYVVRLGQPTPATLTLLNNAAQPVLVLTSVDAGTYVNTLSAEVATGSVAGKRVTIRFQQELSVLDNLQNSLSVGYSGNGTLATLTITRTGNAATRLQTTLTNATDGSISLDLDLTQATFQTVQQLATYINGQNGYQGGLDPYADPLLPSAELDAVAGATIRTPIALVIRYVGAGSAATMTVTGTTLTTTVTGGPGGQNLTIDLTAAVTDTLEKLVAVINGAVGAYTCTLGPNADATVAVAGTLALVVGQDIRTSAYSLATQAGTMSHVTTAALGSIAYALNTRVPRLSATRVSGATTVPANIAQTFFAGGTNPTPTTADWLDALERIDEEDLVGALLFPVTTSPIIQDAVNAWVTEQHTNNGKSFRGFYAPPDFTTAADAKSLALGLNSTFAALLTQPILEAAGIIELPPLYPAAMYCGAASGALPTQPVTRLVLRGRSLPSRAKYSKAVREDLLVNGVAAMEEVKGVGVRISLAITTSLSQDRIDRMLSESMARDVIEQRVKAYVEPLIPHWAMADFMPTVKGVVRNALQSLKDDGILTEGRDSAGRILPAWQPPQVFIQAGVVKITVHCLIGGEVSHVNIAGTIGYQEFNITVTAGA